MKLIKINDGYINADKIIQIYERPIWGNDNYEVKEVEDD